MACGDYSGIVPVTNGITRLKGLDINFTKLESIVKTFTFGNDIVDADTGEAVQLPGKPSYNQPELSTPYKHDVMEKFNAWLRTDNACPNKVVMTTVIDNQYTTHTNCTLLSYPLNIGHDADGSQDSANYFKISIAINNKTLNKLETR